LIQFQQHKGLRDGHREEIKLEKLKVQLPLRLSVDGWADVLDWIKGGSTRNLFGKLAREEKATMQYF